MNAVIYARYSSNAQSEQSIEGQLHDCYAFAKKNEIKIVGEYIDRAITGKYDDRPEFQRMIADAQKKGFERIIVWKTDRFARNRYDSAIYKHTLKKCGVKVLSAMENIGESDESILIEAMLQAMAEYYSLDLQKKVVRGLRESISKKQYSGGSVPFGYKVVDKHIVVDPDKAPIIQDIFQRYADGEPMKSIIDDLSQRGLKGRLGGKISYTTFSRSLVNTAYIGKYTYSGQVIEGMVEPIIPLDVFQKVQERVKQTASRPAKNKAKVDYALSGKVFCGHCGQPMTGEYGRSKQGVNHYYYTCSGHKRQHNCTKKAERKDPLENYVVQQTIAYVLSQDNVQKIAQAIVDEYDKEFNSGRVKACQHRIAAINRELDNLVDTLADAPKIAHQRIYKKMEDLQAEKAGLETDMSKLCIAASVRVTKQQVIAWLHTFCLGDPSDESFRHSIIDAFVNSVYIYDDRIVIFYNLRNTTGTVNHAQLQETITPSSQNTQDQLQEPTHSGSDLIASSPHTGFKSEPMIIFVNRIFGLLFHR